MAWALVVAKSIATGICTIVFACIALVAAVFLYGRYVFHIGPGEAVGWDPISVFGQHWKAAVLSIPISLFLLGFGAGFWFFSRSLR